MVETASICLLSMTNCRRYRRKGKVSSTVVIGVSKPCPGMLPSLPKLTPSPSTKFSEQAILHAPGKLGIEGIA